MGDKPFDLTITHQILPAKYKTVKLTKGIFEHFFKDADYKKILDSLRPARIHPHLPTEEIGRISGSKGVIEYNMENIMRAQREPITIFGNFLKNLAIEKAQEGKKLVIEPYYIFKNGLGYSVRENVKFLPYFPNSENKFEPQMFILDGSSDLNLKTFVLSSIDSQGNIEYLGCFNLLMGAISINNYKTLPTTTNYVSAPQIFSFDPSLYDENNPDSLINVMKAFDNYKIGYQRMGVSMSEERREEMYVFYEICGRLYFIESQFA